ncbi:sodium/glutamate symporter [Parasutterella muris]|jgi:Na+/glutamate symporter|uniref:Sodium:glutamate symporter n=2 Tax=Parasutterella TaxID=577310 RepID=A0A6L6YFC3_9BURK|nr:sodium/glutamate symporter [Parasutterella muris]MVX56074.1 sodium:glutamate symporter [Parasutterella muris]
MDDQVIQNILHIQPNAFVFLGIALVSYFLGRLIKSKIPLLQKLSIPVPFIGGLPVAGIILLFRITDTAIINFDVSLNSIVLRFFLTMLALFGTWKLISRGTWVSMLFWALALVLGVLQALVGIGACEMLGLHKHLGLLVGTISMIGGYDTVNNFAPTIERLDAISGAAQMASGVVTLGMILSLMIGAPLGEYLISKYKLKNPNSTEFDNQRLSRSILRSPRPFYQQHTVECMKILALSFVCMALGDLFNHYFLQDVFIPDYVSCMIFAILIRNFADKTNFFSVDGLALRTLTKVILTIFIALSTCSLRLDMIGSVTWEVLLITFLELLLNVIYARWVYFNFLGRNFKGMLFAVGGLSFSMGVCGNGLSNMQSLCEKYGPSTDGFLVLSIVGLIMLNVSNVFLINFLMMIF